MVRNTHAPHAAKQATATTPIVILTAADPVALGYVASLARPGGSITGGGSHVQELSGKLLEVLEEAVPEVTRWRSSPRDKGSQAAVRERVDAARTLGARPYVLDVRSADEFERAFETASRCVPMGRWRPPVNGADEWLWRS